MTKLKVDVTSDVYNETYIGREVDIVDGYDEQFVRVTEANGEFTAHRSKDVDSIELIESHTPTGSDR